jgi:hypothetical protein
VRAAAPWPWRWRWRGGRKDARGAIAGKLRRRNWSFADGEGLAGAKERMNE